ncbi:acetyl-coenzyme A carboxylase carboxyl transferase subunit alpha, chloroplastic-like [Aristolochia californica]|uniref:acetyl-coenzyme A carboxylase carboxyl transferase subunit alpha, chloroplastic-like n=1 Tax=Aristolochia californica TaxID=171875 RepID=UPI0035D61AF9
MASLPHPSTALSSTSASDLLRSFCNGVSGVPLKALGRAQLGARRADFTIAAKIKKWKKHDYPWPNEIDPDVKGGCLSYLSHFKPLKEKPKLVTLEFEKPLRDLERKIIDVRKMADETGLDFSDQIISLETKYQQALKDLYTHVTPIQRLSIARHPNRPTFLDHVLNITDKWVELHGDRAGYDDPAIVTGIGSIDGRSYLFIGHQKGRNTKENIARNFGMPTPHGYRKALRMMYYADHHKLPIITFIDTPGAFADLKSEELGQGEAIAHNLRTMYGLKVPIVTVVIGEGGSGGALAIGCANKLLMLENAVFFVASPEACAAILWKSSKAAPKAAEKLKITATELCKLKIADGIIPEPLGGAHTDAKWTSQQIKMAVVGAMDELLEMDTPQLLKHRMLKFRRLGGFEEGTPQDPTKKANMKKKEEPIIAKEEISTTSDLEWADEIEKLKQQILKAKENSSSHRPDLGLDEMIQKLKKEVDQEFADAVKSLGLQNNFEILRKEVTKARSSGAVDSGLKDKIDKLKEEFNKGLSEVPNFSSLSYKRDMLKELTKAKKQSEQEEKAVSLKQEINKRLKDVMDQSNIKQKIEMLRSEMSNGGVSTEGDLDVELKEKITEVKKEIGLELVNVLKSLQLDLQSVTSGRESTSDSSAEPFFNDIKIRIDELNKEIADKIKDTVNSSDLKNKIELLKIEVARAGRSLDPESKNKIEELKQQIKESLVAAVSIPALSDKHKQLKNEIAKATGSPAEDERLSQDSLAVGEDDSKPDVTRVEINVGATRGRA